MTSFLAKLQVIPQSFQIMSCTFKKIVQICLLVTEKQRTQTSKKKVIVFCGFLTYSNNFNRLVLAFQTRSQADCLTLADSQQNPWPLLPGYHEQILSHLPQPKCVTRHKSHQVKACSLTTSVQTETVMPFLPPFSPPQPATIQSRAAILYFYFPSTLSQPHLLYDISLAALFCSTAHLCHSLFNIQSMDIISKDNVAIMIPQRNRNDRMNEYICTCTYIIYMT